MTLALVGIAIAAVWVWLALRGRRVDDHPVCCGCGFDLIGLWPTTREEHKVKCPECGVTLDGPHRIRFGQRVRSKRWVAIAAVALVGAFGVAGTLGWLRVRNASWREFAPTWVLLREIEHLDSRTFGLAFAELERRHGVSPLDLPSIERIGDAVLVIQADFKQPWVVGYGTLVERELVAPRLWPAEKISLYARQGVENAIQLDVRARVREGRPVPAQIKVGPCRLGNAAGWWLRLKASDPSHSADLISGSAQAFQLQENGYSTRLFAFASKPDVAITRECTLDLMCEVVAVSPGQDDRFQRAPPITTWNLSVSDTCFVEDRDASLATAKPDPPVADMRNRISLKPSSIVSPPNHLPVREQSPYVALDVECKLLPRPVCFDVLVRRPGERATDAPPPLSIGTFTQSSTNSHASTLHAFHVWIPPDYVSDDTVDLVFRYNVDRAEQEVEERDWWEGELVFEGVKVLWPPEQPKAQPPASPNPSR